MDGPNTVDFALIAPPANNRLANGDFELGGPYGSASGGAIGQDSGWTFQLWGDAGSYLRRESSLNKDAPEPAGVAAPWEPHSGTEASRHCTSGHGFLLAYQEVEVAPDSLYKAYVWVKARNFDELGFGVAGSGDYAGLHIQEYNGTELVLDHAVVSITGPTDWTKLSDEFTTQPTTNTVLYMLETSIGNLWSGSGHWQHGQVVYDDAVLDAGIALAQLTGTVYKDGQPLSGATVTAGGKSATTDENGVYTLADVGILTTTTQVTASHPECWSENKFVALEQGEATIDFDLHALPVSQLLANGDFEPAIDGSGGAPYIAAGGSGVPQSSCGWTCRLWSTGAAYLRRESTVFQYNSGIEPNGVGPGPWEPFSGTQCSRHTANPGGQHELSQTVWVLPNTTYKASVMARRVNLNSADTVGLHITELDSGDAVLVDHTPVVSTEALDWTRLSDDFTTGPTTVKIKYAIETDLSVHWSVGWADYDDAVLDGPPGHAPVAAVTGTVRLDGSPVSGATVTVEGKSAVSGSNGIYSIADIPITGQLSTINVQYTGYMSENKYKVLVDGTNQIDYDLIRLPANNLLVNPGFEDTQAPYIDAAANGDILIDQGWTFQLWGNSVSYLRRESSVYKDAAEPWGVSNGPWAPHSGTEASRHTTSAAGHHEVYQDVPVSPETLCKASLWLRAVDLDGSGFGVEGSGDCAGLHIIELAADGGMVLDHTPVLVTTPTEYTRLAEEFTTQAGTAKVRFMMETYIGGLSYGGHWQHGWVTYDDAVLEEPMSGIPVDRLSDLKGMADDVAVSISGKVVSAAFAGFFYVEESDRSSGIRVNGAATSGSLVDVIGTLKTVNGERVIDGAQVTPVGSGSIPGPLGMNGRTVLDLSGVGLYMTTWGTVDFVATDDSYFTITDGSGASVKVYKPSAFAAAIDDYVAVTGALGAEMTGETIVPVLHGVSGVKSD